MRAERIRVGPIGCALVAALASDMAAQQPAPRPNNGGLPAVSPGGDAIAFVSNRGGAQDVWVTSVEGSGVIQVTRTPDFESAPAWTADGRLVFSRWVNDTARVFAVSSGDTAVRQIGIATGRSPLISRDGQRLLFSQGAFPALQIVEARLDGSGARTLTRSPSMQFNAVWSPDERLIAFARADSSRQLQIWVMHADGTNERQLTHFSTDDGSPQWPAWSPDGRRIAVQSGKYDRQQPSASTAHIWIIDVATGSATKLAAHAQPYLDETPSWFPDGQRIAFQSDRTGRMEIWVMNANGTGARQVTR
ncbi:MAG TPA: hypothetical protein VLE53_10160 [Gemmatimonadaceae bacterium]|nr:hypothetical protein [Gemmatimonadaceae bacterium]